MMYSYFSGVLFFLSVSIFSQNIENQQYLSEFKNKISQNQSVTQIVFLGDSHIQAGWIPALLRRKFQSKYGNAGRGLVFPYSLANSNGPDDIQAFSSSRWETYRLVYDQDRFSEMGALGFVMGNSDPGWIELSVKNPEDAFDEIRILNDRSMDGKIFSVYRSDKPLSEFVSKSKKNVNYIVENGDTLPELAAKFNSTTTKLVQLNGNGIKDPKAGTAIKAEDVNIIFDKNFENRVQKTGDFTFSSDTKIDLDEPTQKLLIFSAASENIFYGFQLLKKNAKNGVIFNGIGVNGATYADFIKYPLTLQQINEISPDLVVISLGTNESFDAAITEENFYQNAKKLIGDLRSKNPKLSILLITPTDNKLKAEKAKAVAGWIKKAAAENKTAFLDMYEITGGTGYFKKMLSKSAANNDGVHFLKTGYDAQAEQIWKAFENFLN